MCTLADVTMELIPQVGLQIYHAINQRCLSTLFLTESLLYAMHLKALRYSRLDLLRQRRISSSPQDVGTTFCMYWDWKMLISIADILLKDTKYSQHFP